MNSETIRRIYQDSFSDTPQQVKFFFDRVYRDADGMALDDEQGHPVSALVLRQLRMSFHGQEAPVGYVCGAATLRKYRGQGYMSRLMREALQASRQRGDMVCTLIPASEALYFFYRRFGFATVFYYKEQRYTSLHAFPTAETFHECKAAPEQMFAQFDRWQRERPCAVLHDLDDFAATIEDCRLDGGTFAAVVHEGTDTPCAMAWGVPRDGMLVVSDAVGDDADAVAGALQRLRANHGDLSVLVLANPGDGMGGRLMPHAMARLVNPALALQKIAAQHPRWTCRVRVHDHVLGDGDYLVRDGECRQATASDTRPVDLDVPVHVLTQIVFSSPEIGEVLDFPSVRPSMNLMMD